MDNDIEKMSDTMSYDFGVVCSAISYLKKVSVDSTVIENEVIDEVILKLQEQTHECAMYHDEALLKHLSEL